MSSRREEIVEESDSKETPSIKGRYHRFNVRLGKGAFKEVYKAFDTFEQIDVAWNSIDLSLIHTEDEHKKIFKECEMLRRLNHPNILKITNQWYNQSTDKLCFITNIVHDGSLAKFFVKRQVNLLRVKTICKQILDALCYLHEKGVIHRDLKCDNIFIEGNTGKVVLGDLGLSCNVVTAQSIVGTPHWMAPELFKENYDEMVDIWSFGMCVLELITSVIPYKECQGAFAVYQTIISGKKPKILKKINNPSVRAFIKICLNINPSMRPTAKELISHPFLFEKASDTQLCSQLMVEKKKNVEPPLTEEEKEEIRKTNKQINAPPNNKSKVQKIQKNDSPKTTTSHQQQQQQQQHTNKQDNNNNNNNIKQPQTTKNGNVQKVHDFRLERATSPAPPSSLYMSEGQILDSTNTTPTNGGNGHNGNGNKKGKVKVKSVKNDGKEIKIKLQIVCDKFPKPMNVEFDFDAKHENAQSVAIEMTRDLELPLHFKQKVERAIKNAIVKANKLKKQSSADPNVNQSANVPSLGNQSRGSLGPDVKVAIKGNDIKLISPNEPGATTITTKETTMMNGHMPQSSVTSLTASIGTSLPNVSPMSSAGNDINEASSSMTPTKLTKMIATDPMYTKPAETLFGFHEENMAMSNVKQPPHGVGPTPSMMPMIRGQSSPDPPLSMFSSTNGNGNGLNYANVIDQAVVEYDNMSSIGSVPQPSTKPNSINQFHAQQMMMNINELPPTVSDLQSSQSVPTKMTNYENNQYINQNHHHQNNYIVHNGHHQSAPNPPIHSISANGYPHSTQATTRIRSASHTHTYNTHSSQIVDRNRHNYINNDNFPNRSVSQQSIASNTSHNTTQTMIEHQQQQMSPKIPPVPESKKHTKLLNSAVMQLAATNHDDRYNKYKTAAPSHVKNQSQQRSISPPKSITPPTPPPVVDVPPPTKQQQTSAHFNYNATTSVATTVTAILNGNTSRSVSPGAPPLIRDDSITSNRSNKTDKSNLSKFSDLNVNGNVNNNGKIVKFQDISDCVLSDGLVALKSLNKDSTEMEIFRITLKLTLDELIEEFVKRDKKYNESEGKNGLSRKLATILKKELINSSDNENTSPILSSHCDHESANDEKLKQKRDSNHSIHSIQSQKSDHQLNGNGSASNNKLKLDNFDSSKSYNEYTNMDNHLRNGTTVVHASYPSIPMGVNRQTSNDAKKLLQLNGMPHTHGHNGHISHVSNYSSASNHSIMSSNTMGTLGTMHNSMGQKSMDTLITMASSNAISMGPSTDFEINAIINQHQQQQHNGYGSHVFGNGSAILESQSEEQKELSIPTVASLKLPFEIEELQLPSPDTTIEFDDEVLRQIEIKEHELHNEYIAFVKRKYELLQLRFTDDDSQQSEIKNQEEEGIKLKINAKRLELSNKFDEWLSDRVQIEMLKSKIEKKRTHSLEIEAQIEFEKDPQFLSLMESNLEDIYKRECRHKMEQYRANMMEKFRHFYAETIQTYRDKANLL